MGGLGRHAGGTGGRIFVEGRAHVATSLFIIIKQHQRYVGIPFVFIDYFAMVLILFVSTTVSVTTAWFVLLSLFRMMTAQNEHVWSPLDTMECATV